MLWKWGLVLLSSLIFIVAALIVIFYGMKNIRVKNENYITFEGLIERNYFNFLKLGFKISFFGLPISKVSKLKYEKFFEIRNFFVSYGFSK
ncbi:hypothetical protein F9Y90_03140 [Borrelia miyamotoi]|uniref:Uncharacterized protein n=1 Tax=Borrelia miyamotoi TaxID=47466 RepID=A0AAX3JM37_9SPIR|nr:hypothetical protein [Borrelia miyamotoi]QFP42092.1 hypothetical protein F9Y90_03140 [Borrelia miyamotoi]QFP48206.1 hypothetical protein F9Y91_03130 [Borrelia miyamotoi]QGT55965.1 hypothetical protein GNY89_03140 [Borrelia miyamotoi]QGT56745.1 hypothetical protein GNY88_03140 [Borrelia miyamotoi]WAZ72007.1 hypothetical protein O5404_03185 [Borrelia miyamotoi]